MRLTFFRWNKSEKLNIDNSKLPIEEVREKLIEEVAELIEVIHLVSNKSNLDNLLKFFSEFWDGVQVLILLFYKVKENYKEQTGIDDKEYNRYIKASYFEHEHKRLRREWKIGKEIIEINID